MNKTKINFAPSAPQRYECAFPVRMGLPFAKGEVQSSRSIRVCNDQLASVTCQALPLAFWPDQSIKWSLVDWIVPSQPNQHASEYFVAIDNSANESPDRLQTTASQYDKHSFGSSEHSEHLGSINDANGSIVVLCVRCVDRHGVECFARTNSVVTLHEGPVRNRFVLNSLSILRAN